MSENPTISLSPAEVRRLVHVPAGVSDDDLAEAAHTFLATSADVWDHVRDWARQVADLAAEGQTAAAPQSSPRA